MSWENIRRLTWGCLLLDRAGLRENATTRGPCRPCCMQWHINGPSLGTNNSLLGKEPGAFDIVVWNTEEGCRARLYCQNVVIITGRSTPIVIYNKMNNPIFLNSTFLALNFRSSFLRLTCYAHLHLWDMLNQPRKSIWVVMEFETYCLNFWTWNNTEGNLVNYCMEQVGKKFNRPVLPAFFCSPVACGHSF